MRAYFLLSVILVGLTWIVRYPFAGILLWAWFTCMDPHQEAYGFVHTLPLNFIIACVTLVSWFFSAERKLPPINATIVLIALFLVWITINGFFAIDPGWSWPLWDRAWKTILLGVLVYMTATNKIRMQALVWVVVVSLLYYGVKGGIFTLLTGGHSHVVGPSNSMIRDNNQLALALLMILPLVNYLRMNTADRRIVWGLVVSMVFVTFAVLGSYSRGAYLALAALGVAAWIRSRNKLLYLAAVITVAVPAYYFMPDSFYNRLDSIQSADTDTSFQGRVMAWRVAWNYARDHFPFGDGFSGSEKPAVFNYYFPGATTHAAHSIYFEVLGDNGFIGLGLYLAILVLAFVNCTRIRNATRHLPEYGWAHDLATMIQLSLFVYCVGGAALSMAYYDVFYIWAGLLCALLYQLEQSVLARGGSVSARRVPQAEPAVAQIDGT